MLLYLCVHRRTSPPAGPIIDAATRARMSGPWTFHDGPATHAFVVVSAPDFSVRLDGQPPVSALSVYHPEKRDHEAGWRITIRPGWESNDGRATDARSIIDAVERHTGEPYDFLEIAGQVLPGFERLPGVPGARICTAVALGVLEALPRVSGKVAARMSTLYPEAMARALDDVARGYPDLVERAW